jgi:4-alpha-glucanotransferase
MTDRALRSLAEKVGLAPSWTDFTNHSHDVSPHALRQILASLGFACDSDAQIADSLARAAHEQAAASASSLISVTAGKPLKLPASLTRPGVAALAFDDDGEDRVDVPLEDGGDGFLHGPAIDRLGYHQLFLHDRIVTLAVAPRRCFTVEDAAPGEKAWGLAAQIYALRRQGDGGIGDFSAVEALSQAAARRGADALALSPTHALFAADVNHYSPYSPSTRLFRNPLHADLTATFDPARIAAAIERTGLAAEMNALEALELIDWPQAARARHHLLRALFDSFRDHELASPSPNRLREDFRAYCREAGEALADHARFEALHGDYFQLDMHRWHWRTWLAAHQDPRGPAVIDFALQHMVEVQFHTFLQWIADRSQAACQASCKAAGACGGGMRVGLIGDLAVGMNSGGSHAWSRQEEMLHGLAIGAPPDALAPKGQNWGLTTFSPQGLRATAFRSYIATLRAMFRHSGGIRIDHAMGLSRLWLVPEGCEASEGAYLTYPFEDLVRLTALESHRSRAIVIGEDLGTVPHGFRERLADAGIYGMRVLQFERHGEAFDPPDWYPKSAVAMTSTHDLPTMAGWWSGRDLAVREDLHQFGAGQTLESETRARDDARPMLLSALETAGAADPGLTPTAFKPADIASAAAHFLALTPARLSLLPIEDAVGQIEQPNLPGTTTEHPNWRRRYKNTAQHMLSSQVACAALDGFAKHKKA